MSASKTIINGTLESLTKACINLCYCQMACFRDWR